MAGQVAILDDNFVVDAAAGVLRYHAVVQGTNDHECGLPAAAGAGSFLGIAQEDKDNGLTANIRMAGNSYARAKGAIAKGAALVIGDTTGRVDTHANVEAAAAGSSKEIIGYALETASALDDLILISINKTFIKD